MRTNERPYAEIIGENLSRLMQERNYSTHELGRKIGVSGAAVSGWCRGINTPRPDKVDKICQIFNINRAELTTDLSSVTNLILPSVRRVPILGTICAGDGIVAEQNIEGYFYIDTKIYADFCLRVDGDSMIGANIYPNDLAFLRQHYVFTDGEIYGVVFGDEQIATLKRVFKTANGYRLVPCNEKYEPIEVDKNDPIFIVGELMGTYHPR